MKLFTLVPLIALASNMSFAETASSYEANISCSANAQNEIMIDFTSKTPAVVVTEKDQVVESLAAKIKIEKVFTGVIEETLFSLDIDGKNSFKMLVESFKAKSGEYVGKGTYSIGTHSGIESKCELKFKNNEKTHVFQSLLTKGLVSNLKSKLANVASTTDYESYRAYYGAIYEYELQQRLATLPSSPGYSCAKGVRLSLNTLFGRGPKNGKNALDYNESILSSWQNANVKYKRVLSGDVAFAGPFYNFDIRVIQPASTCSNEMVRKYGHIEFYYNGVWYSDFRQEGSAFDADKWYSQNYHNYVRCYSSQSIYRLLTK